MAAMVWLFSTMAHRPQIRSLRYFPLSMVLLKPQHALSAAVYFCCSRYSLWALSVLGTPVWYSNSNCKNDLHFNHQFDSFVITNLALITFWFRQFFIVLFGYFGLLRFFWFTTTVSCTSATCRCWSLPTFRFIAEIFIGCWWRFFFFRRRLATTCTATAARSSTTCETCLSFISSIWIGCSRWIVLQDASMIRNLKE